MCIFIAKCSIIRNEYNIGGGSLAGIKVLIVEDSRFFREMFANELDMFLPAGSKIEKASDVYEARSMIRRFRPHVVLLDVQLPSMSGIEFLEQLQHASFATIAISSKEDYREPSLKAGATYTQLDCSSSPVTPSFTLSTHSLSKRWANSFENAGAICCTIQIGGNGGRKLVKSLVNASVPPVEEPIAISLHHDLLCISVKVLIDSDAATSLSASFL